MIWKEHDDQLHEKVPVQNEIIGWERDYVLGYSDEIYYFGKTIKSKDGLRHDMSGSGRPIHRYVRLTRFKETLNQITGMAGEVPEPVLDFISKRISTKTNIWNSIRCILKNTLFEIPIYYKRSKIVFKIKKVYGRKYYNRIPYIIRRLGFDNGVVIDYNVYHFIIQDFKDLENSFQKLNSDRQYFPNLRFVCLKLLCKYGITFNFNIPLLRTKRKLLLLEDLWVSLNK